MKNLDFFKFHSNSLSFRLNSDIWYYFRMTDSPSVFSFFVLTSNGFPLFQGKIEVTPYFIRCLDVYYSDNNFIRFRPDELIRFEPRILTKFRNVSSFISNFTFCLIRLYNEYFDSRISSFLSLFFPNSLFNFLCSQCNIDNRVFFRTRFSELVFSYHYVCK